MTAFIRIFLALLAINVAVEASESKPVQIQLLAEESSIEPGRPFWVAVRLDLDEGWHAYWKNPGASGFATRIDWNLPAGYKVGEVLWPVPERMERAEGVSYGYHEQLFLLAEITPSVSVALSPADLNGQVTWLACSDTTCLPGENSFSLTLPVKKGTPEKNSAVAIDFQKARHEMPREGGKLTARREGENIHLALDKTDKKGVRVEFYPATVGLTKETHGNLPSNILSIPTGEVAATSLEGVLVFRDHEGNRVDMVDVNIPVQEEVVISGFEGGLLLAVLLAFVGGFILNLMPCVLPVISLKLFSLVKMAGEDRKKILAQSLLFTAGVVVSFWVLAIALFSLQASGHVVGWGFQLQEPIFVGILAAFLFVFALSLFGVFELGTGVSSWAGQQNYNRSGAFFSGVLATAVATPCTGPFLGATIGFAMTIPALSAILIFTSVALGMASPYLAVGFYPPLIKFLPKPGNWMVTFKEITGFFMVATTLWLIWVFGAETSSQGLMILLAALLLFAIAAWVYGKWGAPHRKPILRNFSYGFSVIFAAFGLYLITQASRTESQDRGLIAMADRSDAAPIYDWEPFSPERVKELHAAGVPILIDFTAKWCLICQANHLVLSQNELETEMASLGVVKMKADWTKNDPVITEWLKKFGRSGVPLYLLYGKDPAKGPEILPQVLTPEGVKEYLNQLK